ncbi:MAG TPA: DinB family protein [Bryobacteraceae bacterium]|nr:DinB family protein [Bryobacteraceae bacterium]
MASGTVESTFTGMKILAQTPRTLRELLAAATADDLEWQPRPDRWSISMVLAHLADVEEKGFVSRFRAMAAEDNPHLPAYDQLALFREAAKFDDRAELESFAGLRARTLEWLNELPASLIERTGRHEELRGTITFGQLLHEFAFHDLGHIRQIMDCTARTPSTRIWVYSKVITRSTPEHKLKR